MLPFLLMACPDTSNICDPACEKDSCMICDASGDTPVCVSACGEGLTCNSGLCQAPATSDTCDPVCGACQTCDLSGTAPTCVDLCGDNTTCQNGECVAPAVAECSPACGSCQMCDTSGASPVCVDQCGDDTVCDNGACVPLGCDTPCGDCQVCDISGASPVCVDACDSDLTCQSGVCVAPVAVECSPACGACQMCDITTDPSDPICVDLCDTGTRCDNGACVPDVCDPTCDSCQMCDTTGSDPVCVNNCGDGTVCVDGACVPPSCDVACGACETCTLFNGTPMCASTCSGKQVCDADKNLCVPGSNATGFDHAAHFAGAGFSNDESGALAVTAACVSCHANSAHEVMQTAHWNWAGPTPGVAGHETSRDLGKRNLVNNFCIATPSNEPRCTMCHAGYGYKDKTFDFNDATHVDCLVCHSTAYAKAMKTGGYPSYPAANEGGTVDLTTAAQAVGRPTRSTCLRCHAGAGGGDNVKQGDLGSSLKDPASPEVDAHMGATAYKFQCVDCHVGSMHKIPGTGTNTPISEGPLACTDCHGMNPHSTENLNNHAQDIACQTCHIPTYSRQLPTKLNWDWSQAGDEGREGESTTLEDGTEVHTYSELKGEFVWGKDLRPEYAWDNGKMTRMQVNGEFPSDAGTETNPIHLAMPSATKADGDARITPFKVMRGQQPVDISSHKVPVPDLFGPGSFWAYVLGADYDAQAVEDKWTASLTAGAKYTGLFGDTDAYTGRATGTDPQWDWAYTDMYLNIDHEVAPAAHALSCTDCHNNNPNWNWTALGYSCDPMLANDPAACGSRHP